MYLTYNGEQSSKKKVYISNAEHFAIKNKIVINKKKTKVISFTKSSKWDFPPELDFNNGTLFEYVEEIKLVGVVVSQTLKWYKNSEYICQKARQKMWLLRRWLNLIWIYTNYALFTPKRYDLS